MNRDEFSAALASAHVQRGEAEIWPSRVALDARIAVKVHTKRGEPNSDARELLHAVDHLVLENRRKQVDAEVRAPRNDDGVRQRLSRRRGSTLGAATAAPPGDRRPQPQMLSA